MSATKPQIPGTGLPLGLFGAIVAVSVALFVVWGGWLWTAPRETSHLARFTVSYLVVVPLAALALLAVHRWSWPHMLAAVATIWCIKLVVTALLYLALARGTAVQLDPARLEPRAPPAEQPLTTYHAATGGDPHGALAGRVTLSGQPLVGSIVYLVAPPPGRPLTPGAPVDLMIEQARYDRPLTLALVGDTVRVHSRDGELHTVHLREELTPTGERVLGNQPLRPGAVVPLPMRKPGRYRLTCDNHRQETAWLIVADHPYATTTGPGGGFYLPAVPAGALRLEALAVTAGGLAQAHRALTLADGATAQIELALAPPAPAAAATLTPSPLMPAHKENTLR